MPSGQVIHPELIRDPLEVYYPSEHRQLLLAPNTMTQKLKPTKDELIEYGRNLNKLDSHSALCSKLESFAEHSENDGFQLVYISLEDLYAENWDSIQLEREIEWEDYKDVEQLSKDYGYGRTLYPEEAKFLIDMFETESKKEFYVGLICEGVVVDSIDTEAVEEEDETESTMDIPLTEPEKAPLELLAQRTANEHEEAFGKLMEVMIDTDPSTVKVALTELNACRERSKEICGLTEELRVKVEAVMKRQWKQQADHSATT